jgi:DNA-binding MarR family transcriptional regulator
MARTDPRVKGDARHAELVRTLNHAARETSALGTLFAETVARQLGISHSDLECIDIISLRGRVTAGELAKQSGLTTGAITGVIDRLEKAGLARRERDPDDRRKVYVSILPKTLERGLAYYDSFGKAVDALAAGYSDAQLVLLTDYFTRAREIIRAEIEKLNARPPPRKRGTARR